MWTTSAKPASAPSGSVSTRPERDEYACISNKKHNNIALAYESTEDNTKFEAKQGQQTLQAHNAALIGTVIPSVYIK